MDQHHHEEDNTNNNNENNNNDDDHLMIPVGEEEEEFDHVMSSSSHPQQHQGEAETIPLAASLPRQRQEEPEVQHQHQQESSTPPFTFTTAVTVARAASRKRSFPVSPGGSSSFYSSAAAAAAANTPKHFKPQDDDVDDDETQSSPPSPLKKYPPSSVVLNNLSSLDDLLQQAHTTNWLFDPPLWLRHHLNIDQDESMLHFALRKNAKLAAKALIHQGDWIHSETSKGVTPLILASQKGHLECVRLLLQKGAKVGHVTIQGTTAVLQAAHFGHLEILKVLLTHTPTTTSTDNSKEVATTTTRHHNNHIHTTTTNLRLMELSNFHHTTPLMRASQEGHLQIVQYLVERGALVNRKNRQCMTALMLASQRGHADICHYLIQVGHADMDAATESKSTPLLVACKRNHYKVVQVLVAAGCELFATDNRGRTAHDIALARNGGGGGRHHQHHHSSSSSSRRLLELLHPTYQVHCMRQAARRERSLTIFYVWKLLQADRATLRNCSAHEWTSYLIGDCLRPPTGGGGVYWKPETMALLRTLILLPESLVRHVCAFLPLPNLWETRISMLTKRSLVNPNAALECGLDVMDEVLEQGGYLRALDQACIPPPVGHVGWTQWKRWSHCSSQASAFVRQDNNIAMNNTSRHHANNHPPQPRDRPMNATTARVPAPSLEAPHCLVEHRRHAGYLSILAAHARELVPILTQAPYFMPPIMVQQLVTSNDIASLVRRVGSRGGVHFDTSIALDLIMLTSRLSSWYYSTAATVGSAAAAASSSGSTN